MITLESNSTTPGATWNLIVPKGPQTVAEVNVEGSDDTSSINTVTCLNCTDSGYNTNWIFSAFSITVPASGTTVGQTPTVIGLAPPNTDVAIKDGGGNWVATTQSDDNGNFRVVVGQDQDKLSAITVASGAQLAVGTSGNPTNSLTPYLVSTSVPTPVPGLTNTVTVVAAPTINQVPTLTSPTNGASLTSATPWSATACNRLPTECRRNPPQRRLRAH